MSFIRSIVAILAGIGLVSIVSEVLEFTLVAAAAGGTIADLEGYFAVRNRPSILTAKLVYNTGAAVLGGYVTARIAGAHGLAHARIAAVVQTAALIHGFTLGEYAAFTPVWMRIALVGLMGPAMIAGGTIRERAQRLEPRD